MLSSLVGWALPTMISRGFEEGVRCQPYVTLQHFRTHGLTHAKIETPEQNAVGQHLYTSFGFREVARQIHLVAEL